MAFSEYVMFNCCSSIYIGLSNGDIPAAGDGKAFPNYHIPPTTKDYYYCLSWGRLSRNEAIQPKMYWKYPPNNVIGCGLLLSPENKLAVFFTGSYRDISQLLL
jgi:hypothetical protein